jgi:hypothetical protein
MSLNFGELMKAAGPLEALPVGDYDVVCKSADATTTKNGEKSMIKAKFSVESGPHAGRTIYWNAVISPENATALRIFFVQMEALGLNSAFFSSSPSLEAVAQNLVGKRAKFNIAHRLYNGQTQVDVKRVSPAGASAAGGLGNFGGLPASPAPAAPAPIPAPAAPPVEAVPVAETVTVTTTTAGSPPAVPF